MDPRAGGILSTSQLIDAPAPVAAPMMAARPQMATRRDGSVMPAIAQQELARMAASVASGPPAGNGHGAGMGHARQMMPVVELPVLHPADVGPRVSHDPGPPGGRSYDESFVGIPGLSSARPRALMPILVGFLVGAMAVGLLAFGLFQRGESEAAEHQRLSLIHI